ncbi:MAG: hypothetical protein FWH40_04480 [Coriobacteriia bacterium]|nr:hypothetical protein [Coriobacteriia bacterium]
MRPKHILRLTLVSTLVLALSFGLYSFGRGSGQTAGSQGANKAFADCEGEAGIVDSVGSALPATYESAKSAFAGVLLEGASFVSPYNGRSFTLEGYLRNRSAEFFKYNEGHEMTLTVSAFTMVDLDVDGEPELVLAVWCTELNYVIFSLIMKYYNEQGVLSSYEFQPRSFGELKENGMFVTSGGRTHSYCRLRFPDYLDGLPRYLNDYIVYLATEDFNDIQIDESGMSLPTWYVNGELASGNEFAEVRLIYNSSPWAVWYKKTEDNLLLALDSL